MTSNYLSEEQITRLLAPINPRRVGHKDGMSHLEAYDVRAHLDRMFGFARWDGEVLDSWLLFEEVLGEKKWNPDKTDYNGRPKPGWDDKRTVSVGYRVRYRLVIKAPDGSELARYAEEATGDATNFPGAKRADAHDFAVKGLALDTPIPTPTGWTTMAGVQVGDWVLDRFGQPARVTVKSPVKNLGCYRVDFRGGDSIVCDEEHLWYARIRQDRWAVRTIAEMAAAKAAGDMVRVPVAEPLVLPEAELPIDPWFLGYWLGNGSRSKPAVTCHADDVAELVAAISSAGYKVGAVTPEPRGGSAVTIYVKDMTKALAEAGLLGNKHVPDQYLRGSIRQRRALLAGLMDSDGTADRRTGRVTFYNTDPGLSDAVLELATSLGERPMRQQMQRTGYGKTVTSHDVQWRPVVPPFALSRKAANCTPRSKISVHRVDAVTRIDSVPTACIGVDAPDHTYLVGRHMTPTHNTAESQALKRCATNLGDQFGLSLYAKGSTDAIVMRTLVGAPAEVKDDGKAPDEHAPPVVPEALPEVGEESQEPAGPTDGETVHQGPREQRRPRRIADWVAAIDACNSEEAITQLGREAAAAAMLDVDVDGTDLGDRIRARQEHIRERSKRPSERQAGPVRQAAERLEEITATRSQSPTEGGGSEAGETMAGAVGPGPDRDVRDGKVRTAALAALTELFGNDEARDAAVEQLAGKPIGMVGIRSLTRILGEQTKAVSA